MKKVFTFLFVPFLAFASTLSELMPEFNKTIGAVGAACIVNSDLLVRVHELNQFVQTANKVEGERSIFPIPQRDTVSPVAHSEELVSLIDISYQAQLTLCVLLKQKFKTLDCVFHALLKATEIAYQETACFGGLKGDIEQKARKENRVLKQLEGLKEGEVILNKVNTIGRISGKLRPSFQLLIKNPVGIHSSITTPVVLTPGQPESHWPLKQEGSYQYVVMNGVVIVNDSLATAELLVDIERKSIIAQQGMFFEIIPVDDKGSPVETSVDKASHFRITAMGFHLNGCIHGFDISLIAYTTREKLKQLDFQFEFSPFNRRTNTLGGENFLPQYMHSLIRSILTETITAKKQDVFMPLEIAGEDSELYILDQINQALALKKIKNRPLTEEEQETVVFVETLATECGAESLEELKKAAEDLYILKIRDEQEAVTQRVIEEAKPKTREKKQEKVPQPNGKKSSSKKAKASASDDTFLDELVAKNELKIQQVQEECLIKEKLQAYLGNGKRARYRHMVKMINAARKMDALAEEGNQSSKGSHRHKDGCSLVVPHGKQGESSRMLNNGRMLQNLMAQLTESIKRNKEQKVV